MILVRGSLELEIDENSLNPGDGEVFMGGPMEGVNPKKVGMTVPKTPGSHLVLVDSQGI